MVFNDELACKYLDRVKVDYLAILTVKALVPERRVAYNVND